MEPPFATPRASQEKGACASVAWFSHRLGAVTSTWNEMVMGDVLEVLEPCLVFVSKNRRTLNNVVVSEFREGLGTCKSSVET